MLDIRTLVSDHLGDERFHKIIFRLFGWVIHTSLVHVLVSLCESCFFVPVHNIGVDHFTIIFVIDSQLSLSKKP